MAALLVFPFGKKYDKMINRKLYAASIKIKQRRFALIAEANSQFVFGGQNGEMYHYRRW